MTIIDNIRKIDEVNKSIFENENYNLNLSKIEIKNKNKEFNLFKKRINLEDTILKTLEINKNIS